MMMRILKIFILLLVSVWLGVHVYHDPGYLLIAMNQMTIETTLGVAIIGLILLFLVLHTLLLLLHWLIHIPTSWRDFRVKNRAHNAQVKTRQGLIEFSEGHWLRAKNYLIKALPDTEMPLLNYLTAARAAQEMGDSKLRDDYLREAQQVMPEARIAVELTQAQLQLANRQWEQALATLRHLQDLSPQHPYVLKLLMQLYEEVKDWPHLIALLPALKRHKVISEAAFNQLQKQALLQSMIEHIKRNQTEALATLMASMPKNLTYDPDLIAEFSRYLLNNHYDTKAEALLRRCLQKQFSEPLVILYGQIKGDKAKLSFAEGLLKANSRAPGLYLCLGRLCKSNHLWGKARTNIEASINLSPTPSAFAELGALLEELGDHQGACTAYRQGLLLTV